MNKLERDYKISSRAPRIQKHPTNGGKFITYFFEYNKIPLGVIDVFDNPKRKHISWNRFYPLYVYHTRTELVQAGFRYMQHSSDQELESFNQTFQSGIIHHELRGVGAGTLAHTLVINHLCNSIIAANEYTTSYFSAGSVDKKLISLLKTIDVEAMVHSPVSLLKIQETTNRNARKLFDFKLDTVPM